MSYVPTLKPRDLQLAAEGLAGFMPDEIYDIHVHPYNEQHFAPGDWAFLKDHPILGCREHREALQRYMPVKTIHGLYFGMPKKTANRPAMNDWVSSEVKANGTALSRARSS
jgi:glutamate-1-semialdehyde 2,1-aminomutase